MERLTLKQGLTTAVATACALLATVAGPGDAAGDPWSLPETIPGSTGGHTVDAVIDHGGAVTVAWWAEFPTRALAARRSPDGVWTQAARIGAGKAAPDDLDIDSDGNVGVIVHRGRTLRFGRLEGDGPWSPLEKVADIWRAEDVQLDLSGPRPVAAWSARGGKGRRVVTSIRRSNGTWSIPTRVSAAGLDADRSNLEVLSDGTTILVWREGPERVAKKRIWVRVRNADGTWSAPTVLSSRGARQPDVSAAMRGGVVVGWVQHIGGRIWIPKVAYRDPRGHWSAIHTLGNRRRTTDLVSVQALSGGRAVAAWSSTRRGINGQVWASIRIGFYWSRPERLSRAAQRNLIPEVVAGPSAGARVFWTAGPRNNQGPENWSLLARTWDGKMWRSLNTLPSTGLQGNAHPAIDPGGTLGVGCAVFDSWDFALEGYQVQASCLGEP